MSNPTETVRLIALLVNSGKDDAATRLLAQAGGPQANETVCAVMEGQKAELLRLRAALAARDATIARLESEIATAREYGYSWMKETAKAQATIAELVEAGDALRSFAEIYVGADSAGALYSEFSAWDAAKSAAPVSQAKHDFWYAGQPDCPPELKAGCEIHTLKCKVCGMENPRTPFCVARKEGGK